MDRSAIIAGSAAVGGLLAAILVPRGKFLIGALLGAGTGAAASLAVTAKRQPAPVAPKVPEEPSYSPVGHPVSEEPAWGSSSGQSGYVILNGQLVPISPMFLDTLLSQPHFAPMGDVVVGTYSTTDPMISELESDIRRSADASDQFMSLESKLEKQRETLEMMRNISRSYQDAALGPRKLG